MSLARQEADMMQAATHGMELLGENQRLTLDLRQSEAKVTELDGLLQSEFERSAAANKNAEQVREIHPLARLPACPSCLVLSASEFHPLTTSPPHIRHPDVGYCKRENPEYGTQERARARGGPGLRRRD
jgi:hypothetical protein